MFAALALSTPIGCCDVEEFRVDRHELPIGAGAWPATATCAELCFTVTAGDCDTTKRLLSCTITGVVGDRSLQCVYEHSSCREMPGQRAVCGRRLEGAPTRDEHRCDDPFNALLTEMAALEAEAVPAFERLAIELVEHGAPTTLTRLAKRSADEERRHARVMRSLARSNGAATSEVSFEIGAVRPLRDVAIENAAEGCVRETWGALVGSWQAERASDLRLRAAMRGIARDELRHAELSWQIDAWARSVLDDEGRAALDRARDEAIEELRASIGPVAAALVERAGLPTMSEARRLFKECEAAVWSQEGRS